MRRKTAISILVGVVLISLTVRCDDLQKVDKIVDKPIEPKADESPKAGNVANAVKKEEKAIPVPAIEPKPKQDENIPPKDKVKPNEKVKPDEEAKPNEKVPPVEGVPPNVDNANVQIHSPAEPEIPGSIMVGFYLFVALGFVAIVYITYRSFR